ncbi:MAG: tol-pal system-associated acyl-CoA thioesterase [Pseudomonadota bacterium]
MSAMFRYRVYWEDTDAGGVVYHARYLQFLERARSDWLSSIGLSQVELRENENCLFAVTAMQLNFLRPARLEDELEVSVRVQSLGRVRMDFAQTIKHVNGLHLLDATVSAACLSADRFKPMRTPKRVTEAIQAAIAG